MKKLSIAVISMLIVLGACTGGSQKSNQTAEKENMFTGATGEVKLSPSTRAISMLPWCRNFRWIRLILS
jgi:hypothetical protein